MDEKCDDSSTVDANSTKKDKNDDISVYKTTSPVLTSLSNRCKRYESISDDEFIVSQVCHSVRRKSSPIKKKDDYDFIVPFDPVSSPFENNTSNHKIPEIHTIGSLLKNDAGFSKFKYQESKNVFESLGMDKDVSWDSTMASPAPKAPKEELNTIERQTLLPEDGFRNIQPRALFSPTSLSGQEDDGGFEVITHSSDSDLSYENIMRLSDVCETLKELNVKSLESRNSSMIRSESPVLKKQKIIHKKKGKIVNSPVSFKIEVKEQLSGIPDDSFQNNSFSWIDEISKNSIEEDNTLVFQNVTKVFYESNVNENEEPVKSLEELLKPVKQLEEADVGCSHKNINNLNYKKGLISFSNIVNEENKIPLKRGRCEISGGENREKKKIKSEWDPHEMFQGDDVLESQLCKTMDDMEKEQSKTLTQEKEIVSQGEMNKSEIEIKKNNVDANNVACQGSSTPPGKNMSNSDEIIANVCADEFSLKIELGNGNNKPEAMELSGIVESEKAENLALKNFEIPEFGCGFRKASGSKIEINKKALSSAKTAFDNLPTESFPGENIEIPELGSGFKKASGSKIKINEKALLNAKTKFDKITDEVENAGDFPADNFKIPDFGSGFKKASGSKIKISEKTLSKAKTDFDNLSMQPDEMENFPGKNFEIPDFGSGFKKASGSKIKINEKALSSAKAKFDNLTSEAENAEGFPAKNFEIPELGSGFKKASGSKIKINEKTLSSAKAKFDSLTSEAENAEDFPTKNLKIPELGSGFKKASGSKIKINEKALLNAKVAFDDLNLKMETENSTEIIKPNEPKTKIVIPERKPTENMEISSTPEENAKINFEKTNPDNKNKEQILAQEPEETVPSWLQVHTTSPSILEEFNQKPSFVSDVPYVKSPVLGRRDRFFRNAGKSSSKKLDFENEKKLANTTSTASCRKRESSDFRFDFSVLRDKKPKLEENSLTEAVIERRKLARLEQKKKSGSKVKVKPKVGHFLKQKLEESQTLFSKIVSGVPGFYLDEKLKDFGIRDEVIRVKVDNAVEFKFNGVDFFGSDCFQNTNGFPVGDDCFLILNDENQAGAEEFKNAFLASPDVEPSLITEKWVLNHYKWIVWKLAHYETSFPEEWGGKCLTPENVMLQLKYRYDREIDRSERSSLKKILEGDDTSVKRMVLCVCSIKKGQSISNPEEFLNSKCYKLGLTDGWYSCNAHTDLALIPYIESGKITIGTKLVTCGAELVNGGSGISPLEVTDDVYLKISTNSTRRIRWDVKLGFQKNPGPIPISLNSILPQGGVICRVDVIVVRVYPIVYVEKKQDGSRVTRNRRLEDRAASAFQQEQEARIEKIYSQLQAEFQKSSKSKSNGYNLGREDLSEFLETCSDPSALQLSTEQESSLADYRQKYNDHRNQEISVKLQQKLEAEKINKRDVSELLKVKVIDLRKPEYKKCGLLSLWNPSDDTAALFQEGKALSLTNLSAGNYNRSFRNVRLNTTRHTRYSVIPRQIRYPSRSVTRLCDITPKFEPSFDEIDIVGMVVYIQEISSGSKLSQIIYLTDSGVDFVGIVFWGSCRDFGWENVLTVRSIVAASNLQWLKNSHSKSIPSIYANENTLFTENPRQNHLQNGVENVKKIFSENISEFVAKCQEKIISKLDESINKDSSNCNISGVSDGSLSKIILTNGFGSGPNASSTPLKSGIRSLDMNEQEPSPIMSKIEKLKRYGEPPPVSPLPLIPRTFNKKFKSKFKVPLKQNDNRPAET